MTEYFDQLDDDISLVKETDIILKQIDKIIEGTDEEFKIWRDIYIKHDMVAEAYCEKGNYLYCLPNINSYIEAIKCFNRAISYATADSITMAQSIWCRSTVLYDIEKYEHCIKDCDLGASIQYCPDLLKAEFRFRKISCYAALKDPRVFDEHKKVSKYINKKIFLLPIIRAHFLKKLQKLIAQVKNQSKETSEKEQHQPQLTCISRKTTSNEALNLIFSKFDPQPKLPYASKKIEAFIDDHNRKFLKATADVNIGEIILFEKSYDNFKTRGFRSVVCDNCFNTYWTLLPCDKCVDVLYCSEECKNEDWTKCHKYLCNVLPSAWGAVEYLDASNAILDKCEDLFCWHVKLAILAVVKAKGIDQLKREIKEVMKMKTHRNKKPYINKLFCTTNAVSILSFKLVMNKENEIEQYMVRRCPSYACQAVYYLAVKTDFFGTQYPREISFMELFKNKDVVFMAALILRISLTMLYSNAHREIAYMRHNPDMLSGIKLNKVCYTLHPFARIINHSCDPNVEYLMTADGNLLVWATKPIKKDSEIYTSYTEKDYYTYSKAERQESVKLLLNEECKCFACENDLPTRSQRSLEESCKLLPKSLMTKILKILNLMLIHVKKCRYCIPHDVQLFPNLVDLLHDLNRNSALVESEYPDCLHTLRIMYYTMFRKTCIERYEDCVPASNCLVVFPALQEFQLPLLDFDDPQDESKIPLLESEYSQQYFQQSFGQSERPLEQLEQSGHSSQQPEQPPQEKSA